MADWHWVAPVHAGGGVCERAQQSDRLALRGDVFHSLVWHVLVRSVDPRRHLENRRIGRHHELLREHMAGVIVPILIGLIVQFTGSYFLVLIFFVVMAMLLAIFSSLIDYRERGLA